MKQVNTFTTPPGGYQYRQPETNQPFVSSTWQGLVIEVGNHRMGERLDTSFGWEKQLQHDACEQHPEWDCKEAATLLPAFYVEQAAVGRALWGELHAYAAAYPVSPTDADRAKAKEWLNQFAMRVPQYGCGCRSHWNRLLNGYPPELGSRSEFVIWTENAHSWVSRRIGKEIWHPERFNACQAAKI